MTRTLLVIALLAGSAHAEPDPVFARRLSMGVTIAGAAVAYPVLFIDPGPLRNTVLAAAGVAFFAGPSLGHVYGGQLLNEWLPIRVGGFALLAAGITWKDSDPGGEGAGTVIYGLGSVLFGLAIVGEIADAQVHTRRLNSVSLVPTARGIALSGAF